MKADPFRVYMPNQDGKHFTIIGAIDSQGKYIFTVTYTTNRETFIEFL